MNSIQHNWLRRFSVEGVVLACVVLSLWTFWILFGLVADDAPGLGIHRLRVPFFEHADGSNLFPSFRSASPTPFRISLTLWFLNLAFVATFLYTKKWYLGILSGLCSASLAVLSYCLLSWDGGMLYKDMVPISLSLSLGFAGFAILLQGLIGAYDSVVHHVG